jgi:hypothetical protein
MGTKFVSEEQKEFMVDPNMKLSEEEEEEEEHESEVQVVSERSLSSSSSIDRRLSATESN